MVKVVIDDARGLVQSAGSGLELEGKVTRSGNQNSAPGANSSHGVSDSYGVHEVSVLLSLAGRTLTATDNGLIATLLSVPPNSRVLQASIICTETQSDNETAAIDICFTADAASSADAAITSTGDIFGALDMKSSSLGTAGTFNTPEFNDTDDSYIVDSGATGDKIVAINRGVGNGTTAKTAGTYLLTIKYLGAGPAVLLTTV